MNILVTGASGVIGRHFVEEFLLRKQGKVFCLVRDFKKAKPLIVQGANCICADITQPQTLRVIEKYKLDAIVHCAAYVGNKRLDLLKEVTVQGTERIARIAWQMQIKRFVYLSSVAVISGNPQNPLTDDLP